MNFQFLGGILLIAIAGYIAFANLKTIAWPLKLGSWAVQLVAFAHDYKYMTACVILGLGVALIVTIQTY